MIWSCIGLLSLRIIATCSARFSLSLSHLIEIASTAGRGHTGFWNEQGFENLSLKLDKGYAIIDRGKEGWKLLREIYILKVSDTLKNVLNVS